MPSRPAEHPVEPAGTTWPGHERSTPEYRRLLAALFFAGIATFAQLYSPQAALPQIAREFGVGAANAALVISAATIGLAIGVIPWSIVADRVGRVRAMTAAVTAATVFGILVPFAPSFPLLLTGRLLEGLMVGGVPAVAIAYLSEEIAARHTAAAAGTFVAGTTIGGLVGRLVAGPVAELSNWRVGVFAVAALCGVAAALFVWLTPTARGFVPRRSRQQSTDIGFRGRMSASIRSPRLLALYAQAFLLMGGFVALYNFLGFRLAEEPFNLPHSVISLVFLAYLAGTWSSAQAGALATRFGRLAVLVVSIAVMIAGVLLTLTTSIVLVLLGLLVATAGFFAAHAISSGWTGSEATVGRAQASSFYNLFYYAGSSLFGWLGGVLFLDAGWFGTASLVAALALIAAGVAIALMRTPTR